MVMHQIHHVVLSLLTDTLSGLSPDRGARVAGLLVPQPGPAAEPSLALGPNQNCQPFESSNKWDGAVLPSPSSQLDV